MADTKISALTAVTSLTGTSELAVNEAGTSKKVTVNQLNAFSHTLISGNSGTANQQAAPSETWQLLTSNATANLTTTNAVVMTTSSLPAGTYMYRYDILAQSATLTVSMKFAVDSTATVTRHVYHLFYPSQGVTAATGVIDQDINVTTGAVWAHVSTRTDNTTLGPFTDVDTINADLHFVIEGILVTSTSGNLTLAHGSETATSTQVMSGTMLRLNRVG
jgi:hypothetical protein